MEIIVKRLSEEEIAKMGIRQWPIWEKEPSRFEWTYDSQEECLFLEGEVIVHAPDGRQVKIHAGDYVIFPTGLSCTWQVLKQVRKHYRFQ
ncbi:MAG: cupin domain-containing protein [candidate division FCPU426 bacterium]